MDTLPQHTHTHIHPFSHPTLPQNPNTPPYLLLSTESCELPDCLQQTRSKLEQKLPLRSFWSHGLPRPGTLGFILMSCQFHHRTMGITCQYQQHHRMLAEAGLAQSNLLPVIPRNTKHMEIKTAKVKVFRRGLLTPAGVTKYNGFLPRRKKVLSKKAK